MDAGTVLRFVPKRRVTMNPEKGVVIDRDKCNVCLKCADECYAQALRPVAKSMTIDEILRIAEQDKGFYDNTGGGITISGGEVLKHAEFVSKLIDEAGKQGINVCIDTCGFGDGKVLLELALKENVTDILYDMKSIDDQVHREYMGVSNQLILDNLRMLAADARTADKVIMRMPLIKGVNDSDDIIKRTGELYREIGVKRVNLLPYHCLGISKKRNVGGSQEEFEQPTEETFNRDRKLF